MDNKDCNTVPTYIDFCKTASLTRFCRHSVLTTIVFWGSNTGNAIITIDCFVLREDYTIDTSPFSLLREQFW